MAYRVDGKDSELGVMGRNHSDQPITMSSELYAVAGQIYIILI